MRVPIQVNGVAVDCLSVSPDEPHLLDALGATPGSFASAPVLIYLKLKSPRLKDRADIVELITDRIICRSHDCKSSSFRHH